MFNRSNSGRPPARARAVWRAVAGASAVVATAILAACADAPTPAAPQASPRLSTGSAAQVARGIRRATPIGQSIVTRITVDQKGGVYEIPGGLQMSVPRNIFARATTLTVTTRAGAALAYEFEPHGLVFSRSILMRQDLSNTDWKSYDTRNFRAAYFPTSLDFDAATGTARAAEILATSVDQIGRDRDGRPQVLWDVHHFSGYMVSWGFQDSTME